MPVPTLSPTDVVRSLAALGLLDDIQTSRIAQDSSRSAKEIGNELVRREWLTQFQWDWAASGRAGDLLCGQYILCDEIGRGGKGVVYKARHKTMKRIVALKTLRQQAIPDDEDIARFHREVEMMAKLDHPNIVTAFDAGVHNGNPYLAMEWVDGTDLGSLVHSRGPLAVADCLHYLVQAAQGLDYAHRQGVIHRDVKPANLMLRNDGVVKVLDMGLAKLSQQIQGDATSLTGTNVVMGTPAFLAPEQAIDFRTADHRADIYSLGCTMYFLLTGDVMYSEQTGMAMIQAHMHQPIPRLTDVRPDAGPEVNGYSPRWSRNIRITDRPR